MVRSQWTKKIEQAWKEKSVIWLTGVRRSGKTTLCKSIAPDGYFDCELPRIRKQLEDPEFFFQNLEVKKIVLDEVHRLENASEVLKIAADHFPQIKIIATGSSTLGASKKFKDTLTDRKRTIFLSPLNLQDLSDFKKEDLERRMLHGGLPPFFLADHFPESAFQEWIDSFWSKDIDELFSIDKKHAFLKFFELLALQSGGIFEAKSFASPCGVSHTTIASYLSVLEKTHIAYVLRPFHKNHAKEIISAPKVYFFDTGLMNYFKGKNKLALEDRGIFWEHIVVNELLSAVEREYIHYWRDKSKNEVDLVIKLRGAAPVAIECKWQAKELNLKALAHFKALYKDSRLVLVSNDVKNLMEKKYGTLTVTICPLKQLNKLILDLKK